MRLRLGECQLPLSPQSCHPSTCLVLISNGRQLGLRSQAWGRALVAGKKLDHHCPPEAGC